MSNRVFTSEERAKLTQLVNEGTQVLQEVEDLNDGLRDTIKSIAEEMEIKPGILTKAIKAAHKRDFGKQSDDHSLLETILQTVGRTD
jgi:hypothetical protein